MDRMEIDVERNEIWEWEPSRLQRWAKKLVPRFCDISPCCCLALPPQLACNILTNTFKLLIFEPSSLVADGIGRARSWEEPCDELVSFPASNFLCSLPLSLYSTSSSPIL